MKTTRHFEEQVLRKRPYIQREWCERALSHPVHREIQPETVHNVFPDCDFRGE